MICKKEQRVKPGFHTCVSTMYGQIIITSDHSLRNKSLPPRSEVAHDDELLRELARPVPQYAVTVIYKNQQSKKQKKIFCSLKIRAKPKTKKKRRLLKSRYF